MDFSNKVVLITGAGSGIGAATAIYLSRLSADLVLVGRNDKNLQRIMLYCEKLSANKKPQIIIGDVSIDADNERIIQEAITQQGKLDILINNAGIFGTGGIKNMSMETYDKVMSTNLRGVCSLTMIAVPHLIKTKGCIVNVSCLASTKPSSMALAYNMSKAGLDSFTKCIALELAKDGVRVNSVNPSFVKTNMLKNVGLDETQLEMFVKNVVGNTPLKKSVEGDEVAALIAYLASSNASSITGMNYVIDGGNSLV